MTLRRWRVRALCMLVLGIAGCGGSGEPMTGPPEVPVGPAPPNSAEQEEVEQLHVYIAHGREITETFRALQKEIDDEKLKSGHPAVLVERGQATTMNVEDARLRIAKGALRMRWKVPDEATNESGIVWSVPLVPRK